PWSSAICCSENRPTTDRATVIAPMGAPSFSMGTDRAPRGMFRRASSGSYSGSRETSGTFTTARSRIARPARRLRSRPRRWPASRAIAANRASSLWLATSSSASSRSRHTFPDIPPQRPTALRTIASNTGCTRLVWEFTHSHRSHGWLVLEAASVSYGKATTYFPVIELLRSYFAIEPRDDGRKMREKVTGKLLSLDRALEPTLPVFLSLLDVPVEDPEWTRLDPPQRRRQTLEALKRLLLRESQVHPVLLVVEELHWIDGETQAWLDLLVESLPTARLL